jgi:hypothetical protein
MRDGLEKHGLPINAEDIAGFDAAEEAALSADKRRRKLWAIDGAFSCSLIGTCLSQEDAAWLMRRLQVAQLNGAAPYEIHRFLVRESSRAGVAARLMHKRLEAKYAGMVKRFSKESDSAALSDLWENAVAEGKVAAAYWALLTHPKTDDGLKARAFGDVHMLSHINGGENRKLMQEHTQIARRFADLEQRFLRGERAAAEKLAGRDKRIRELEEEVARLRSSRSETASPPPPPPAPPAADTTGTVKRLEKALEDYRRRAGVERWRARKAEEENRRLRRQAEEAGDGVAAPAMATRPVPPPSPPSAPDDIAGKSILYVGGRPHVLRHIKAGVEARKACLLHHDGGMEQTTRSLEGMVERADIVVCPVDCVSHDACLRVKSMCKQRGKPFLPLRNAGASSFHRALNIGEEERPN